MNFGDNIVVKGPSVFCYTCNTDRDTTLQFLDAQRMKAKPICVVCGSPDVVQPIHHLKITITLDGGGNRDKEKE